MTPILFTWDGEAMVPRSRFAKLCDGQFVIGEDYPLIVHEARSIQSHRHYFAVVHDGWMNLPEDMAVDFPTSEHLRKYALIKAGYCNRRSIACGTNSEALRVASFVEPIDEFAVVTVNDQTVTVYTAQSQSLRAMGKKAFQESKERVLGIIAGMVRVDREQLEENARSAA